MANDVKMTVSHRDRHRKAVVEKAVKIGLSEIGLMERNIRPTLVCENLEDDRLTDGESASLPSLMVKGMRLSCKVVVETDVCREGLVIYMRRRGRSL